MTNTRVPALHQLLVHANDRSRPSADRRVVAELLARRGVAGDFVVPAGRGGWRALLAYNRLRPTRVRFGRAALGLAIAAGLGPVVTQRRTITARPGDRVLLDYLSRALGEPHLRIAGTDRPCRDFVTPVIQLFTDDGRCVGFAKIGWDSVTHRMIDDEVEALRRVRAAAPNSVRVPAVLWHGYWQDLAVMVTAPMPTDIRRLPRRARVPVDPLAEIAAVDGPLSPTTLRTSEYLRAATDTGFLAATLGRREVLNRVERIDADLGDVELTFGRWHGDWVPWNLGRSRGSLFAWDWAYSATAVPFGFDVLHFTAVPDEVLRGASRGEAAAHAIDVSAPALLALGLDDDQVRAVAALHRLELELRAHVCLAVATARTCAVPDRVLMTGAPATTAELDPGAEHVRAVAREGALNLVGSVIYGAANFVFLAIVTNALGPEQAGPVVVAIAVFTVVSRIAELGASTGLVRMISRDRAVGRPDRITPTIFAACLPVLMVGTAAAFVLMWCAPALAELFGGGKQTAEIARQVRILAPFVPIASIYTVLVQGSRGFGTMNVLVGVDKIGRSVALVVLTGFLVATGGGATGVVVLWGATTAVATVVTIGFVVMLTRRCTHGVTPAADGSHRKVVASFWAFSLPRAAGQSFDVAVLWLDTLLVAALIGPTAAGIYAAGTRFLLIGTFTAEAIQQAVAPRVSALITLGKREEAHAVITQATSWQAAITWPIYLGVIVFSGVLLGTFGPEYVQAQWALILLSFGLLVAVVGGPSDAVILMSGRSRQSLANSTVAFTVNLVGNLVLVPIWGITAAGGVWAATLIVAAFLPAWQARRSLGLAPWSRELGRTIGVAVATVGTACVLSLLTLGATVAGLVTAVLLGATSYAACMWWQRDSMHLQSLLESLRGGSRRTVSDPRPFQPRPTLEHS